MGFVVRLGPDGTHGAFDDPVARTISGARVFADGYIANVPELRTRARAAGRDAASSVAGWIALAHDWFGDDCASRLHGQFRAVIVDPQSGTALLLQDGMGLRPLFYIVNDRELVAATSLGTLAAIDGVTSSERDPRYAASFLLDGAGATSLTPWRGVRRLVHGRCVRWRRGRIEERFPCAPSPTAQLDSKQANLEEQLRGLLSSAVSGALPGAANDADDHRVAAWCELSAGLDSTSVLYTALAHGSDVAAVSFASTKGLEGSDAEAIRALAPQLPCSWHSLDTDRCAPFSTFPPSASIEPQFAMDAAKRSAYASLLDQHRVHAVLTGVGGDLTFGSEDCLPWQLADGLLQLNMRRLRRDLREWSSDDANRRTPAYWFRTRALPFAMNALRSHFSKGSSFDALPEWLDVSTLRGVLRDVPGEAPPLSRDHEYGRAALWREAYRQAAMASRIDRGCAADFRHPLLDRRLLEFALALPYPLRNTSGSDRVLQRATLAGIIPEQVRTRRTKGTSQAALDTGLRSSREWRDLLHRARHLQALGCIDTTKWRAALDRAVFGVYDSAAHFYRAAALEAWLECGVPAQRPSIALESIV